MWKIIQYGEIIAECPNESIAFAMISRLGDKVVVRISFEDKEIVFVGASSETSVGESISETIKSKQIEEFKKTGGYIPKVGFKFCTGCNRSKPLSEFGNRKSSKDGKSRRCKECVNKYYKERYKNGRHKTERRRS